MLSSPVPVWLLRHYIKCLPLVIGESFLRSIFPLGSVIHYVLSFFARSIFQSRYIYVTFLFLFFSCIIYNKSFINNCSWINFYHFASCGFLQPGESSFRYPYWVLYSGKLPDDDCRSKVCFVESSWIKNISLATRILMFLCSRNLCCNSGFKIRYVLQLVAIVPPL